MELQQCSFRCQSLAQNATSLTSGRKEYSNSINEQLQLEGKDRKRINEQQEGETEQFNLPHQNGHLGLAGSQLGDMCPLKTWWWELYQCISSRIILAFYLGNFATISPSQDLQIAVQFTLLGLQAGYREGNKGEFNSCCSPSDSVLRNELSCGTRPKQLGISGSVWYETDAKRLIYKILIILERKTHSEK